MEKYLELCKQHKEIMDNKNIFISVYINAGGFLWQMMKVDNGTGLGWSGFTGGNLVNDTFTSYEKALEDAIELINLGSLEKYQKASQGNFHWGNFAGYLKSLRKMKQVLSKSNG